MKTIVVILWVGVAAILMAPDADPTEKSLTREDKIQILCGENAAWIQTEKPGEIQCFTKHGRKTIKKIVP